MKKAALSEFCSIAGGIPAPKETSPSGNIPFVRMRELGDARLTTNFVPSNEFLTKSDEKTFAAKIIQPGATLFPRSGSVHLNHRALLQAPAVIVSHIAAVVPNEQTDPEFLYYLLASYDMTEIMTQTTGLNMIKFGQLKDVIFKLPDTRSEQSKIAEILSLVDRSIEQTEELIAKQQRIKTGLMQDLLTRGIDEHGNIRSEATHAFKDSQLGRIPVEWDAKLLDDCVRSDAPICYGILMPGTGVDDGVPVIKVKDIFDGAICLDDILLTDPKIDAAYKRSRLRANDLLITIRGTTGRVALVPSVLNRANITQDTARIRLKDGCLPYYFFYLLQSAGVQAQVDMQTLGQAVKGINIAEVRKLRVPVPPEGEQGRICLLLEQIQSAWQASVKCRDKLLLQKAGMMKDLLTGERRVTPLLAQAARQ